MKSVHKNKSKKIVLKNDIDKPSKSDDIIKYLTIFKIVVELFNGVSRRF